MTFEAIYILGVLYAHISILSSFDRLYGTPQWPTIYGIF